MNYIDLFLQNPALSEALNYRKTKPGTNIFTSSTIADPNIQAIIDVYSTTMGVDRNEVQKQLEAEIDSAIEQNKVAERMTKNMSDNQAASSAFNLVQKIDLDKIDYNALGVQRKDLLNGDVFFDLCEQIIVENADFFPLKNPFSPRSIKPFFYIAPDDVWMMKDDNLKGSSQGDFTAFCTPNAQMVFNRNFCERMALYSVISGPKSTSGKYKSNGGKFPDWYEYLEFVIVHELLHFAVGDHFYTKSMVQKIQTKHPEISTSLAHKILNYVGDFVNNFTLVNSGYAQLPIGLFSQDINYDRFNTYEEVIEAVIEEFKKLNPQDQNDLSNQMSKQQDDHMDSEDQQPSQGGQDGEPSDQSAKQDSKDKSKDPKSKDPKSQDKGQDDKPGDGQDGQSGQDGEPGDGQDGQSGQDGEPGDGQDGQSGQDGEPGDGQDGQDGQSGQDGEPGEGDSEGGEPGEGQGNQPSKIDQAMQKAQERMANKKDNDQSKKASDVLNKTEDHDEVDHVSKAKKEAGQASTLLNTTEDNTVIDWQKLLKKMIPSESVDTEETYTKMAKSATSTMLTVKQTGAGRIKPGETLMDPEKKSLLFVIDNSGSVYDKVGAFNNQIIKLLEKFKGQLDNFFIMKFSDTFDLYKVNIKDGKFQEIDPSTIEQLFDKSGKKLNPKVKLIGPMKNVKTDLFKKTFGGGTTWKPAIHFMVEAFWKAESNIVLFTDDDFAGTYTEEFKKFYKLADKKRGQVAMFISDERSLDRMNGTFGKRKWITVFK